MKQTEQILKMADERIELREAIKQIRKMSRYDTNHDNILYNYQDIHRLCGKLLRKYKP